MKTICIINQKGGVCKTTSTINLAYYFQMKGKRVLMIDTNEQSNLSETFISDEISVDRTLFTALKGEVLKVTKITENLDIIPSKEDIAGLDYYIQSNQKLLINPSALLKKLLKSVEQEYDYCIIDCPAQTALITTNALSASDYVLIPMKTSQYSWDALQKCVDYILEIKEQLNSKLILLGIFLTFYQPRLNSSKETLKYLQSDPDCAAFLLNSTIRQSQDIVNIEKKGSIFEFNPKCAVADDFAQLAEEILNKMENQQ